MDSLLINIQRKMKERHLTAYAIEKKTGLKKSTIHNILLRRVRNPSIETVHSISKALECSVSELIDEHTISSLFVEDTGGHILNWRLYIETLIKVGILLEKINVETDKRKIYELIEEVYQYSLRTKKQSMDKDFAEWALHKLFAKK
jgi:transcriptional regulator with XRE-family HTH domain